MQPPPSLRSPPLPLGRHAYDMKKTDEIDNRSESANNKNKPLGDVRMRLFLGCLARDDITGPPKKDQPQWRELCLKLLL